MEEGAISSTSSLAVTKHRKSGRILGESVELYRSMIESFPDSIVAADTKGVVLLCNTAATRLSGYSKNEIVGKHFSKIGIVRSRDVPKYLKIFTSALRRKTRKPFELTFYRKDGTIFWADIRISLLKMDNKTIVQSVIRDVTERKKKEEALQDSEECFRSVAESATDAIISVDNRGNIVYWNKAAETMFGYSTDEIIGKPLEILIPERIRERFKSAFKKLSSRGEGKILGEVAELVGLKKDGSEFFTELSLSSWETRGEAFFTAIVRDITERKRLQWELGERVKELNILYSIAKIAEIPDITLGDIYQKVTNVLPQGWQYPEITCARITIDGEEFKTKNWRDTEWKLSSDIKVYGAKAGVVEVGYLEERAQLDEGPFL